MNKLFENPALLLLIVLYAPGLWLCFKLYGFNPRKFRRSLLLHLCAATCFVFAWAGLKIAAPAKQIQIVVAADVSDSVFDLDTQSAKLNELLKPLDRENTQLAMIVFGGNAGTERPMMMLPEARIKPIGAPIGPAEGLLPNLNRITTVVDRGATDLGKALDFARGAFPNNGTPVQARGILLMSDFQDTRGLAQHSAAALFGSQTDLLVTPALLGPVADVRVAAVHVPAESAAGRSVPIEVTVASLVPATVQVSVWRQRLSQDAAPVGSQVVTLAREPGMPEGEIRKTVRIIDTPDTPGVAIYTARISGPDGAGIPNDIAVNNQMSAAVRINGRSRWAVLARRGSTLANLSTDPYRPLGADAVLFPPSAFPKRAGEYKPFSGILVDGLPARELKGPALEALAEAVESGKALVALGGEEAFGAGAHQTDSPWERILPVEMVPDDDRTRTILFVIDVSKSMDEKIIGNAGGVRKLDFAAEQLAQVVQNPVLVKPTDRLGMVIFSGAGRVAAPVSGESSRAAFLHAIKDIHTEASTDLLEALKTAGKTLESDSSQEQIVVLLSDGEQTVERPRAEIIAGAKLLCPMDKNGKRRTILHTFGIGTGPHDSNPTGDAMMQDLAKAGGGQYFPDFLKLAEVLERTLHSEKKDFFVRRDPFKVTIPAYSHPLLAAATGNWPVLSFRNRVKAKPGAEALLWSGPDAESAQGIRPDPLLIISGPQWQGASRRAVLALSADKTLGQNWLSAESGKKLLPSLLAWSEVRPTTTPQGWKVSAETRDGDWLEIEARGHDAAGAPVNGRKPMFTLTPLFSNLTSDVPANRAASDPLPLRPEAPGLYRMRMRLPPQGIYRLSVVDGTEPLYEEMIALPYAAEYQRFGTDRMAMQSLVTKAGGDSRVIESARDLSAWVAAKRESQGDWSLRPLMLVVGLVLLMTEFALRGRSVKRR